MGYLHIDNLYKPQAQDILLFKECYALEKIHGTSAHISFTPNEDFVKIDFYSGGETHERFVGLFDEDNLRNNFMNLVNEGHVVTVYGEAYGGKQQGMSNTYGKELKFVVFDVKIGDMWLSVTQAECVAKKLGLEFVWYTKTSTDLDKLNQLRDQPSQQAKRNGILEDKNAEGVVLRPLIELKKNNGSRVICKHKRDEFKETKTKREVSPEQMKVLNDAVDIAEEWVTKNRLDHVIDKLPFELCTTNLGKIIPAMVEDIKRESEGEVVWSKEVSKAISKKTSNLVQTILKNNL